MNLPNRFISFFHQIVELTKEHGTLFAMIFILKIIYHKFIRFIFLPPAVFVACLRPLIKIRFIYMSCLTIGHYSLSVEILLCKLDQDRKSNQREKIIFLQKPQSEACNVQLHKMWKRAVNTAPNFLFNSRLCWN